MFAIREVVQQSLGFGPSELVFAHTVRGPLKLLREKWLCEGTEHSLLEYVSNFRLKLRWACETASGNLEAAQARMNRWCRCPVLKLPHRLLVCCWESLRGAVQC